MYGSISMDVVSHRGVGIVVLLRPMAAGLMCALLGICLASVEAYGQRGGEGYGTGPQLLTVGGGPGNIEQQVAALDFAQMQIQAGNKAREEGEKRLQANKELVSAGLISPLDLMAPAKAVEAYNDAVNLIRSQHAAEAITRLQKAIALYPNYVSAHNALGLAFSDTDDVEKAKSEFERAVQVDDKYPGALLNLGRLAISQQNYGEAEKNLAKALSVRQHDAEVLTAMAYAQNGLGHYRESIQTVERIHQLPHSGMGNAHYVAAAAALALQDGDSLERELKLFLDEDPMNPLAPVARQSLNLLTENRQKAAIQQAKLASQKAQLASASLANNNRLKDQLNALGDGSSQPCSDCGSRTINGDQQEIASAAGVADIPLLPAGNTWTLHKVVDEVALLPR